MGNAARMGPGYFPAALGILLAAIGLVILGKAILVPGDRIGRMDGWLLLRVLISVAAFALLLYPLVLVMAAIAVVLIAGWAGHEFRLTEALINAVVLAGAPYPLRPRFRTRRCRSCLGSSLADGSNGHGNLGISSGT